MIEPTVLTWILAGFGTVIFLLLMSAQFIILIKPKSQQAKDILIGKGEEWRDRTHFKSAYAFAWADWLVIMPLLVASNIGVLLGQQWGYILWIALGILSIYFSIVFWVMEKEYTYPTYGPLAYYTYFWGFYLYWGVAVIVYSGLRL
ncbi:hypothetical protein HQ585_16945 [candidate division KSB1 bacterium]|nr:hypothetical protein [candidate division KSB1 bacterium]